MDQKKIKSGASGKDGKVTGKVLISALLVTLLVATQVMGQESGSEVMSDAANANNPLADMVAFNIQNYHYSSLYGTDESANTAWLRYAQPFGRWLMRASLPIGTVPVGGRQDPVSGLGDFNVFFAYLFSDPSAPQQFGVGRPADLPDRLRWRRGAPTSLSVLQHFMFIQLGKGTYMGTAPLWIFNFENDTYNVPLGIRLGKVVKAGRTVFNMFIEPQYTVLHDGVG